MLKIEQSIQQKLQAYFSSPAYQRRADNRFVSLKIALTELRGAISGNVANSYGLAMPTLQDIESITNCSTCPATASRTAQARARCEQFATAWLRLSAPKNNLPTATRKTPKPLKEQDLTKKSTGKEPLKVPFNIQAFKKE